jgi:ABC-type transport system involved in cytochrome bd biosynthesis fused ATPase/permease subunit
VLDAGLGFMVGPGGKRLTQTQRQKVGLARALLKRPDLLIVNRGLNALSSRSQQTIMSRITAATRAAHLTAADAAPAEESGKPWRIGGGKMRARAKNGRSAKNGLPLAPPVTSSVINRAYPYGDVAANAIFWVLANPVVAQAQAFDRIVLFQDGRIVEDGPAQQLLRNDGKVLKFLS